MSNIENNWFDHVPNNWNEYTIGSLFFVRNDKVNDTDYPPLSVSKQGVVPQMENVAKTGANDNRKRVAKNDFVINSRSDRKQSCGVSSLDGSVSLINTVIHPYNYDIIIPWYANYLMKHYGFAEEFYKWGHGIVADLWTTRWQEMKGILLPLPSVEIQKTIMDFLDKKSFQIDILIANQEQQVERLKAYKQSLITETVTKGLNPDAPMKDRGIEWIGQIPEHWEIKRMKFIADSFSKGNGITKEDVVVDGNTPCVRYGEIYTKYNYNFDCCYTHTNKEILSGLQYFTCGDILFTTTGELVEEIGKSIAYLGKEQCLAGGDVIIMKHSQIPKFLGFALDSLYARMQKGYGKTKLKVVHTSVSNLGNVYVAIPPLPEQQQIADYLDEQCDKIDALIEIKQQKIVKLTNYKKSLIYEYVIGKKEVTI